jgi:hypothetical protein
MPDVLRDKAAEELFFGAGLCQKQRFLDLREGENPAETI